MDVVNRWLPEGVSPLEQGMTITEAHNRIYHVLVDLENIARKHYFPDTKCNRPIRKPEGLEL